MYGINRAKCKHAHRRSPRQPSRTPPAARCSTPSGHRSSPLGVADLARAVGLHPNSVREQLRRLEAGRPGAGHRRRRPGDAAGRACDSSLAPEPEDPYRVLAGVLADQVAALPDAPAAWEAAGERWGRSAASAAVPTPHPPSAARPPPALIGPHRRRRHPPRRRRVRPGARRARRRRDQPPGLPVPAHRAPPPPRGVRHPPRVHPGRPPRAWLHAGRDLHRAAGPARPVRRPAREDAQCLTPTTTRRHATGNGRHRPRPPARARGRSGARDGGPARRDRPGARDQPR